jgi:hypothetical protein
MPSNRAARIVMIVVSVILIIGLVLSAFMYPISV